MSKNQLKITTRDLYQEYYTDPGISVWREISARDKARNVVLLWSKCGGGQPSIVDIGCGDGALIQNLDQRDFATNYIGLEISESGLDKARSKQYHNPCNFILFDGWTIPFRDQSFDLAILSHVLEHVECPRLLLCEAGRIARYVIVEVPLEFHCRTPHHYEQTSVGHINLYNPLLLRQLVESSGLRVMTEQITCPGLASFTYQRSFWKGWLHWTVKTISVRLSKRVATTFFTYHGCLMAEKQPK